MSGVLSDVKDKAVPVHAVKAYGGNRNIAPLISNLGFRRRGVVVTPRPICHPAKEHRQPLGGHHSLYGRCGDEKNLLPIT